MIMLTNDSWQVLIRCVPERGRVYTWYRDNFSTLPGGSHSALVLGTRDSFQPFLTSSPVTLNFLNNEIFLIATLKDFSYNFCIEHRESNKRM